MFKTRKIFWALVLFGCAVSAAGAADARYATKAVVRIPSHGASATVIDTGPGYSWILGCGHAYQGGSRNKPMAFDIYRTAKGAPKKVGSVLADVDYKADLSLVYLADGPLEYVAPIAPVGHNPAGHAILSCGFDEMEFPPHEVPATILSDTNGTWYTREKPWHGRSGGGLIDMTSGYLIGVTQGYEVPFESSRTRGMYVDLATIQRFINRYAAKRQQPQQPQQFQQFWQPQYQQRPAPCPGGG